MTLHGEIKEFRIYTSLAKEYDRYPKITLRINDGPEMDAPWLCPLLGILGESGELADKYKKILRDNGGYIDSNEPMHLEASDILWYLAKYARDTGSSLMAIAGKNIMKLAARAARGTLQGSGDNR